MQDPELRDRERAARSSIFPCVRSRHRSEHRSKHCIASQSIAVQVIFGDYNGDFEIGSVQYRKVAEKIKKSPGKNRGRV
jgi:hypothetical protein